MQPISKLKHVDEKIALDAELLFTGEKTGHVGYLCYGSSEDANDHVSGADMWTKLRVRDEYYPASEDDALIKSVINRLPSFNMRIRNFIDLGPGDRNALNSKTLPLIQMLKAKNYISVDMAEAYAHEAANHVAETFQIKTEAKVANFLEHELPINKKNAFIFIGGSTISNIPVDIRVKDPTLYLSSQLSKLRDAVDDKSYLLVGFDANQDKASLDMAYGSPIMARLIEDTMWRIARDTAFNFDPGCFKYHGQWHPEEHRYAHSVITTRACAITLGDKLVRFDKGHILHLQNSYKFPVALMTKAALNAGWAAKMVWSQTDRMHCILLEAI